MNPEMLPATPVASTEGPITVADVQRSLQYVEELRSAVMVENVHYGRLPGCDHMVLLQPGAEKLQLAFRLAPEFTVEDLSAHGEHRYRVTCTVRSITTGAYLGNAQAECSSAEDKYAWRRAVCDQEWEETPPDRRRIKWGRGQNNVATQTKQVRTAPADQANTVLAMAAKRAQVRAVRGALAVSDLFVAPGDETPTTGNAAAPQRSPGDPRRPSRAAAGGSGSRTMDTGQRGQVLTFGKYKGKSLAQVAQEDPSYVEWLAQNAENPQLRKAATEYIASGGQAGGVSAPPVDDYPPPPSDEDAPSAETEDPFAE